MHRNAAGRLAFPCALLALAGFALWGGACRATAPDREAEALAVDLRRLYAPAAAPGERWRRRTVRLPDGREAAREEAYRDHPRFPAACRALIRSRDGDDAMLGAWLLGTMPAARAAEAEAALVEALASPDPRAAFEAALALERVGGAGAVRALERAARSGAIPDLRTAARIAVETIGSRLLTGRRSESAAPIELGGLSGPPKPPTRPRIAGSVGADVSFPRPLAPSFRRGVSWWFREAGQDSGATSFRRLAALGVTWVSIHTWDPLQRGLHDPIFAGPGSGFVLRALPAIVRSAHAAGLAVMVKPHLEMRGYEPTPEERRILRGEGGSGGQARRRLVAALNRARAHVGNHNRIEMRSEGDWRRWFRSYESWLLPYAEAARDAGADAFCVGRELDTTVARREADWRRLIGQVRGVFPGPLTYSANFDTWQQVRIWDALDSIGVSAYFPLSDRPDPSLEELAAGWRQALAPLEEASRRYARPVLLTEAGFPSIPDAARAPWREAKQPADVWLQARCYEATLRAAAARPFVAGAFFWLWEPTSPPPFRDPSHALPGKPAAYVMARWYRARGELRPAEEPSPPPRPRG